MFSYEYCKVLKKILFKEYHRWLLLYFHLMTYVNREIDDIYFPYKTLYVSILYFFIFFAISFETL